MRRHRAVTRAWVTLVWTVAVTAAACASPDVTTIEAFVTRDGRLTASPLEIPHGETIVTIRNDQSQRQRPVLVRTNKPSAKLPVVRGVVPVGAEQDVTFDGDGYTLVAKLEPMRAFFSGEPHVARIHAYLQAGTYELFSNLRGHYDAGKRIRIQVSDR